ncbi:hypothetical protein [Singulisphaera acidiphila]|uniref:Uncharacterized protein n=1 Tax=Singulisphaera acidiphila (strain ATCC BAA-1392 / DSM 18658 / VKM B-2454 / MOB10) TaxID=886293 RepID=L0D8A4_SINAD|nr:hypothetical protein [Singulisphaera acidiphila]AGA25063.1 hypothetical protein Sinac_0648 [Singulisphaera acidiphila DSM 18658]
MWRIGAAIVVVGALGVLATGPMLLGRQIPLTNREGLVSSNDGSLYYVLHPESNFAIYLSGNWNSSARSSSNTATNAWKTDVRLHAKGKPDVMLLSDSAKPTQVVINGTPLNLASGSLFRVKADGKIEQLPFAPLPSSDQDYLQQLNAYFSR